MITSLYKKPSLRTLFGSMVFGLIVFFPSGFYCFNLGLQNMAPISIINQGNSNDVVGAIVSQSITIRRPLISKLEYRYIVTNREYRHTVRYLGNQSYTPNTALNIKYFVDDPAISFVPELMTAQKTMSYFSFLLACGGWILSFMGVFTYWKARKEQN